MIENEIFIVFIIYKKVYLYQENFKIEFYYWYNKSNVIVYNYFNIGYLVNLVKLIFNLYFVIFVFLYEWYVVKGERFSFELF